MGVMDGLSLDRQCALEDALRTGTPEIFNTD